MCSSETKLTTVAGVVGARINGRPVLQPSACNRVPLLDRYNSIKRSTSNPNANKAASPPTTPISPKSKSPRPPATKGASLESNGINHSSEKAKSFREGLSSSSSSSVESHSHPHSFSYPSALITEAPGSVAAVRREQMALQQAQRKMRIAHYGRSKSAKFESKVVPLDSTDPSAATKTSEDEKRCSFITPYSDPIYVAYHDEEWGVPVHDDKMLFELLVLSGAQVGSDWASIMRKRQDFRNAFAEFDAEAVAKLTDKQINAISSEYGIDISRVRGVADNSSKILEIKTEFGTFDKYIWGFVNHKPISPSYKFGHKIPVKTSKSESISKDMIRRGFRFVGATVIHSFMQAAGLTNDHLITCHRHLPCALMARAPPKV